MSPRTVNMPRPIARRRIASIFMIMAALVAGSASTAHAADVRACSGCDLSTVAGPSGAGMSQPFSTVVITNRASRACSLRGYPQVVRMSTKKGPQEVSLTNGRLGNIVGGGPRRVVLAPGGRAWFAVGAATAYDAPLVTFTSVTIALGRTTASTAIALQATAPSGKPFPIGVTAFTAGVPPAN